MRFTIRLLGQKVIHVDTDRDQPDTDRGDHMTYPVGFAATVELPIREPGRDLE